MTTSSTTQFTVVDDSPDASWCIQFMDQANTLPDYDGMRQKMVAQIPHPTGARILDAGCGTGDDSRLLASLVGPDGGVVGIDSSEAMVAEAGRRADDLTHRLPVEYRTADLCNLDIPDHRFDVVWSKLVLMHCDDIEAAADELVRVLKPGGRLIVFDYDFDTATIDHSDVDLTRRIVRCASDGHPNNQSGRQLKRRFTDLGLVDIEIVPHTVRMSYEFYRSAIGGRIAAAQADGLLDVSLDRLEAWWAELDAADEQGVFFASTTGFVAGGSRP